MTCLNAGDCIQLTCTYPLDNSIGDEGVRVLAESWKQNTTLMRLNLESMFKFVGGLFECVSANLRVFT